MAATATAPAVSREIIEERWRMATTSVELDEFGPARPHPRNSKAMTQLMRSLETIAGRMTPDGLWENEEPAWEALHFDLLRTIEAKIKDFAYELENAKAAR